jgi:hypothetical protein
VIWYIIYVHLIIVNIINIYTNIYDDIYPYYSIERHNIHY